MVTGLPSVCCKARKRGLSSSFSARAVSGVTRRITPWPSRAGARDLPRLGRGAVLPELLVGCLEDLLAVLLLLHVDQVEHDDAAQVAEANLPHDLLDRLEVGLEDR